MDVVSDDLLLSETKRMLEFAGLYGYDVDVKYSKLDDNVGGNIILNDSLEKAIHVNVSEKYRRKYAATIAILAHEICHKILSVNNLNVPLDIMNEVYTDLTTIYMGFGEIIIEGYNMSSHNDCQILGYLTPETYKVTNAIVYAIFGEKDNKFSSEDIYAEEAIENWNKYEDKEKALKAFFIEQESQIAELHRNILLLEGLLYQCKQDMLFAYENNNEIYYKLPFENDSFCYPIAAFSAIYESNFKKENPFLKKLIRCIDSAIFSTYTTYQEKGNYDFIYDFSCPFCGNKGINNKVKDRIAVIKCPKCKKHYTFDARKWNVSSNQKLLNDERKKREQIIKDKIETAKRRIEKDANDRIQAIIKETNDRIKATNRKSTETIDEIRANEEQRTKEKIIKKIPLWLRWLVKEYFV